MSLGLISCCDCFDDGYDMLTVNFVGFNNSELNSFLLISNYNGVIDTTENYYIDTLNSMSWVGLSKGVKYQIKSKSYPYDNSIKILDTQVKRSLGPCRCIKSVDFTFELNGVKHSNQAVTIEK